MTPIEEFRELGIDVRHAHGEQRAHCPKCQKRRKNLAVNVDDGLFFCHCCGYSGRVGGKSGWLDDQLERLRKSAEEHDRKNNKAAQKAQALWASAGRSMWHPYLKRKAVLPLGIRQRNRLFVVPMYDADGRLWNCQTIDEDGTKLFLRGGRTKGLYYPISGESEEIYVCEGFATGAALHLYFRHHARVAVAFNCGNLKHVGIALREKHPDTPLVFAADNDQWTEGNPGLTKAKEAANTVSAQVIVPNFEGFDTSSKPTDFCDLHLLRRGLRQ